MGKSYVLRFPVESPFLPTHERHWLMCEPSRLRKTCEEEVRGTHTCLLRAGEAESERDLKPEVKMLPGGWAAGSPWLLREKGPSAPITLFLEASRHQASREGTRNPA